MGESTIEATAGGDIEAGDPVAVMPEAEEEARRGMRARAFGISYPLLSRRAGIPAKVAIALVKAQRVVKRVGHDAANSHHGYRYTSAEAVIDNATAWLDQAGLALVQYGWHRVAPAAEEWMFIDGTGKTVAAEESAPARLTIFYALCHDSGEVWEMPPVSIPVLPEKGRPLDKAEATALTYSLGYVLRGLLKIPRSDDGTDVNQRPDDDEDRASHRAGRGRVIAPAGKLSEVRDRDELAAWMRVHGPKMAKLDEAARATAMASLVKKGGELGIPEADVLAKLEELAPKPVAEVE
jgi:hypothetical protein